MKTFKRVICMKPIAIYLAVAFLIMTSIPADSLAYVIQPREEVSSRAGNIAKIQRVLEIKMVSQRLSELGLSIDEIRSRLDRLSDTEMHSFASRLDTLYAGGSAIGVIMGLLVIAILLLVILQMTGRKIIIK
ncbi:MAG: PA2779 family protein [Thermodesulfobacteriota bacterium]